jgi:hypothetical protein
MTTSFVGLENLPNVYFRDISIYSLNGISGQQKHSRVEITLVVKDTKIDNKFQWVSDDLLNTYLNVKIMQSMDKDFTQQLSSGDYTLSSFDYKKSSNFDQKTVKTLTKRIRPKDNTESYSAGDNIYEFEYKFSFDVQDSNLIDVAYFASLTLDLDMMQADFGANFDEYQIRLFQGPISSEKIFVDGALQTKTNVFYLPDNQMWSGPVHLHEGKYMAGAFHTAKPHPTLRLVETENLKLKDKRSQTNEPKELNTFDEQRRFIGKPYCTRDENNNIKKILYFDMENMFIEKTKYGELIKNLSPKLFEDAINGFSIKKLVIKRKFVKLNKATNSFKNKKKGYEIVSDRTETVTIASDETQFGFAAVGPVEDSGLRTIQPDGTEKIQTKLVNEFRELTMSNKRYRYFTFVDKSFKDIKYGNYIYGIELSIIDKTKVFLSNLFSTYKNDVKALEVYQIRSRKKVNSLKKFEKFTSAFAASEKQLYGLDNIENLNITPWSKGVENYMDLKSYLYNLSEDEKISEAQKIFNSINPKTGTSEGISAFIEQYRSLLGEFTRKFDLEQIKVGTFNAQASPLNKGQTHPNLTFITYDYDDISSATARKEGYKIFDRGGSDRDGARFLILNRDSFNQRRQKEVNRFFKGKPNYSQDESKNLTKEDIEDLSDITSFSSAYLSPLRFIYDSRDIDLSETNLVDDTLLNNTIEQMTVRKRRGKKFFGKRFSMKKFKSKKSSNDENPKFENVSEYLGTSSPLLNLDFGYTLEDLKDIEKIKVEKKMKDAVSKKRKKRFINAFDLTKTNNIIFKEKRNKSEPKRKRRKKLRKIPIHTKAIMASRSQNVRTNILNSQTDLLGSNETDNKLLIEHFAIQKIEYLVGFEKDKSGNPVLNNPKWELLDLESYKQNVDKTLICRSISYSDEIVDLTLPPELSLEVFDSYFIIEKNAEAIDEVSSFASALAINYNASEAVNYDYSTTNIMIQSRKENGIFTEPPEPNKPETQNTTRNGSTSARQRGTQRSRGRY